MSRLIWDAIGERRYETGVDHVVLYPVSGSTYPKGVAWSGVTSIAENPSGAENNPYYADNIKYFNIQGAEDFGATLECYYYPEEWSECNGLLRVKPGVVLGQQRRKSFGLSYRTKVGSDTDGSDHAYKIHLIYGASATPSSVTYNTTNESPEPNTLSFEMSTIAIPVNGLDSEGRELRACASLTIESEGADPDKLKELEDILYGSSTEEARLPLPDEILTMFGEIEA